MRTLVLTALVGVVAVPTASNATNKPLRPSRTQGHSTVRLAPATTAFVHAVVKADSKRANLSQEKAAKPPSRGVHVKVYSGHVSVVFDVVEDRAKTNPLPAKKLKEGAYYTGAQPLTQIEVAAGRPREGAKSNGKGAGAAPNSWISVTLKTRRSSVTLTKRGNDMPRSKIKPGANESPPAPIDLDALVEHIIPEHARFVGSEEKVAERRATLAELGINRELLDALAREVHFGLAPVGAALSE